VFHLLRFAALAACLKRLDRLSLVISCQSLADRCPLYPRKRTCAAHKLMSALGQKRTHAAQQKDRYSITWSARASSAGGTVMLSALAVLRLRKSSTPLRRT